MFQKSMKNAMAAKMDCVEATIGVTVRSMPAARVWYERLLGKPPELEPVPGVIEFRVGETWLQLEEGQVGSGGWVFRMGVQSLEQERTRLTRLGITIGETVRVPGVIQFCDFKDPDGNSLSLYELLTSQKS